MIPLIRHFSRTAFVAAALLIALLAGVSWTVSSGGGVTTRAQLDGLQPREVPPLPPATPAPEPAERSAESNAAPGAADPEPPDEGADPAADPEPPDEGADPDPASLLPSPGPRGPVAAEHPTALTRHGDQRVDPLHWMVEPELLAPHLAAERAHAADALRPLATSVAALLAEHTRRRCTASHAVQVPTELPDRSWPGRPPAQQRTVDGLARFAVGEPPTELLLPDSAYWAFGRPSNEGPFSGVTFTSMRTPQRTFAFDAETGALTDTGRTRPAVPLLAERGTAGAWLPEAWRSSRIWARAPDGARVPVSVLHPAGEPSPRPTVVLAHGSHGLTLAPRFRCELLGLAQRGFVVAIAHLRGGGALGHSWHDAATGLSKHRTVDDLAAAAGALLDSGWSDPSRLYGYAEGAGALPFAALANERPDLFDGLALVNPEVDPLTSLLEGRAPGDLAELGDPAESAVYDTLKAWSPYDNLRAQAYPAVLVALDGRGRPWEGAKWVARLRALRTDDRPTLLLPSEPDPRQAFPGDPSPELHAFLLHLAQEAL